MKAMHMRKKRGQMLIVAVLGIVFILMTVSSLLISTYLTGLNLKREPFREAVTQIRYGSRASMATALADVSKLLNQQMKSTLYQDYADLEEQQYLKNRGFELLSDWQNDTMRYYPSIGLSINLTGASSNQPGLYCDWNETSSRTGYTKAVANVSIGLLNYGFAGFKEQIVIEFNATIHELIESDGNDITFKVEFVREMGYLEDKMAKDLITVLFETYDRTNNFKSMNETEVESLQHLGDGIYVIAIDTNLNSITYNLDELEEGVSTQVADNVTRNNLLGNLTQIEAKYAQSNVNGSWYQLLTEFRPVLVAWDWNSTSDLVPYTDELLSQLKPYVRVVAVDYRAITVSAYGELAKPESDIWGPDIYGIQVQPSQCIRGQDVNLHVTADDRYSGGSDVSYIEYFVSANQPPPPQYGDGYPLSSDDGAFDESIEGASITILSGNLSQGVNKIWIHGQDSNYIWGEFDVVTVNVIQDNELQVQSITMTGHFRIDRWGRRWNWVRATVTIVDGADAPVANALVHGYWRRGGYIDKTDSRTTQSDGTCIFNSVEWRSGRRTYTFTVDSVSKSGYVWYENEIPSVPFTWP